MSQDNQFNTLKSRFRGYFPVVIDVETAGFNSKTDALLEICAVTLQMDEDGWLKPATTIHFHVAPFEGAILHKEALEFNGIRDPFSPLRGAVSEEVALKEIYKQIRKEQKNTDCTRAIMVAHNATFDHSFVMAASERAKLKRNPFHPFATFDTAALSGLAFGQTVLAKACQTAEIPFDNREAHSALYDTERTAELFCKIVNKWKQLGGWPLCTPHTEENDAE
ncbi:ribonuclease T [Photobacterium kishitanii]|uniref:Ribonuclease T n=1 Tax=Photobacterium kishitanii TaxID=318456 RepID=A0A0B7JB20_9GAMM|nr:ribonuclease T [Photobacterium kishitanii]OBU26710.1 ribonuclease T [Photobacterium kishitanii]PSU95253.1 ribonuclease T [Photobacterium kishitanii]PSU97613.1 ribonuclease T [Photobacterium kishitanii]PSV16962.1 ribonuclease T [Photobacterium kishitanii]PSW70338.1 ribonuclease T [Photobacterium kishitanii]